MTQSGQGEEPSARPAHEGIVLPSDGGQPLLPGMTGGGPGGAPGPVGPGGLPPAQPPAQAPAEGQAWGQPWGPGPQQTPPPQPGQGWQAPPAQPWDSPESYPQTPPAQWDAHGPAAHAAGSVAHPGAGPLPPEGSPAPAHGAPQPPYPQHQPDPSQGAAPLPPAGPAPYGTPLPPATAAPYGAPGHGAPADEGATQYLPPVAAAPGHEAATQYLPPTAAAPVDEGATQYIPPVTAGAMPSAVPGGNPDAQATQYIAPVDAQAGGMPAPPYGAGPADAGGRQTPAEFDNLFRGDAGGGAPATQQLPRFQQPHDGFQQPHDGRPGPGGPGGAPFGPGGAPFGPGAVPHAGQVGDGDGGRPGRRNGSRVPLIAAVGVGIVVVGVGAGALLSGGGDDKGDDKSTTVSATAPATGGSSSAPAADPARQQAVALDKLLAESGNSRSAVIKAVGEVKTCKDLGQAASALRTAAKQRVDLVTRLGRLPVDKLPDHAALTSALTSGWKASQSADEHYAKWADQAHSKKVCKKGHARTTNETQAATRQSGTASAQKAKAAQLWNAIAKKYGLTQRQPTQL